MNNYDISNEVIYFVHYIMLYLPYVTDDTYSPFQVWYVIFKYKFLCFIKSPLTTPESSSSSLKMPKSSYIMVSYTCK